jgi:hypothetical protein
MSVSCTQRVPSFRDLQLSCASRCTEYIWCLPSVCLSVRPSVYPLSHALIRFSLIFHCLKLSNLIVNQFAISRGVTSCSQIDKYRSVRLHILADASNFQSRPVTASKPTLMKKLSSLMVFKVTISIPRYLLSSGVVIWMPPHAARPAFRHVRGYLL